MQSGGNILISKSIGLCFLSRIGPDLILYRSLASYHLTSLVVNFIIISLSSKHESKVRTLFVRNLGTITLVYPHASISNYIEQIIFLCLKARLIGSSFSTIT